jgi:hypothetical protein
MTRVASLLSEQRAEVTMAYHFTSMLPRGTVALFVFAALLVLPDELMAQAPKYEITGFRDARFGMTESSVRAIARESFGAKDGEMTVSEDAVEGTTMLIVHVPVLEVGLGEGRVAYIFGYRSRKLIQVNVIWGEDTNPRINDSGMIAGATRLQRYFLGFSWMDGSVRSGIPIGDNAVLLFSGYDNNNAAVRLILEGVRYQGNLNGTPTSSPDPITPSKLTINYISNDLEIRKLNRRQF